MSYYHLRKKYPRLSDKLEVIQTLSNMMLIDLDYIMLNKMECLEKPSNRFIRTCEKNLQKSIEDALSKTSFNIVFSNLNFLSNNDVSDTNKFTCFIVASGVLQLSKTCFVATVVDPINIAEKYNGKEYNCSKIRCYAIKKMEFFGSLNTLVF